jgi:Fic family protein
VGTIHYSTLIEGNRLGILEAARAARGELDRTTKAEIELVNYVDALNELDRRLEADGLAFDEDLFKAIHYEATKGLGTEEGPFKPHHEGEWRDGEAGVLTRWPACSCTRARRRWRSVHGCWR